MLWGNNNDGNHYKISILQYISMKISEETLLLFSRGFHLCYGERAWILSLNAISQKISRRNPFFSRRGSSLMLWGNVL